MLIRLGSSCPDEEISNSSAISEHIVQNISFLLSFMNALISLIKDAKPTKVPATIEETPAIHAEQNVII